MCGYGATVLISVLLLVLLADIAAFVAYLVIGFDQALLPTVLLMIAAVLVASIFLGALRGRDPFARLALRSIRRRVPDLVGALAVEHEGRRRYLVYTSDSLRLWGWHRFSVDSVSEFDLAVLRSVELLSSDPDHLDYRSSDTPASTIVLDNGASPVRLRVRTGQLAVALTHRIAKDVRRRR